MRAPFNRTMDVFNGPDAGGGLRLAAVPCRVVKRDESDGVFPSPPFYAWVTCPIANILVGSQMSPSGEFTYRKGDRLFDAVSGAFIGIVLWAERWLPALPAIYQRVYVATLPTPDDGLIELATDMAEVVTPVNPVPGPICLAAGVITLGVSYTYVIAAGAQQWFTMPTNATTHYTVNLTVNVPPFGSLNIFQGICAALVAESTLFNTGTSYGFSTAGAPNNLILQAVAVLIGGPCTYTFSITSP